MTYAEKTDVAVTTTKGEIDALLRRHKATAFATFEETTRAMLVFQMQGRRITFKLPLPDRTDSQFTHTRVNQHAGRTLRSEEAADKAWEQACRSRWRALYLCIRAKLESVESGIETFEEAFLAHVTMPDGRTVGEHTAPMIAKSYETQTMQPLLPSPNR